jgi:hypothetical protein
MIQLKIKVSNGFNYEQYQTNTEVCKRMEQLREKGIDVENDVEVKNYR